ncbi:MAG: hypothetical protein AAB521_02075 [Patescibacteria group bacterium]
MVTITEARPPLSPSEVGFSISPISKEESPLYEIYSFAKDAIVDNEEALRESITVEKPFEESLFSYEIIIDGEHILVDFKPNGEEIDAETSFYYGASPNGTTGRLFSNAKELMTEVANARGKSVNYRFVTNDPELKLWAIAPDGGNAVFEWDETALFRGRLEASRKIIPIPTNGHKK